MMAPIKNLLLIAFLLPLLLLSCKNKSESEAVIDYNERLTAFFEREFKVDLEESPMLQTRLGIKDNYNNWDDFSHERHAADRDKAKRRLAFLKDSIEEASLDSTQQLNYRLYHELVEQ